MMHNLKIKRCFADAILSGTKTFEIRKNDRPRCFQEGDLISFTVLSDSDSQITLSHPLDDMFFEISYVLSGWGLESGYVALAIKPLKEG